MPTLTVAHKVIIGFSFIALLLILSSGFALVSFSKIDQSNQKVNTVAVPIQQQSNSSQIQLLKQAKLSALGYNADATTEISRYQQAFLTADQALKQQINQTRQLNDQVAAATETQLELGQAIDTNMLQMVQVAADSSEKAQRTLAHSDDMAKLATQLKQDTSAFKIH